MGTRLSDEQLKNIMISMYPKKDPESFKKQQEIIFPSEVEENEDLFIDSIEEPQQYQESVKHDTKTSKKKWTYSIIIAFVSVMLFSSFVLNILDDMCIKKNINVFDEKGEPTFSLLICIFLVLVLTNRFILNMI